MRCREKRGPTLYELAPPLYPYLYLYLSLSLVIQM